jgi:RNA polymerase sigma-70 factor (ECF subfamily)
VFVLDIADGQVQTVRSVISPAKLRHLGPLADMADLRRQLHSQQPISPVSSAPSRPVAGGGSPAAVLFAPYR